MKVKKIAALAVGAAMVGATIGLASAQPTVPNIPKDFFVKNGQPNVKIVVGSQGAAMDVASAADIAVAIGTLLYTEEDVAVKSASVVVKKDVSYDPDDIPVFDNLYRGDFKVGMNVETYEAWWNGSFDSDGNPIFNANLSASAWSGGVFDNGWDVLVPGGVEWKTYHVWKDPNGEKHKITDVNIYYTIHIGKVTLKQLNDGDVTPTNIDDFNDFTLQVDNVVANVTFSLNAYEKTLWDPVLGAVGTTYTVSDLKPSGYALYESDVIKGVTAGDTISLFGKNLKILDIGSNYIEYGNDWGDNYINVGETKTFGNVYIKPIDIDVSSEKALLDINGVIKTLHVGDTYQAPDGSIRVTLKDTFIGIGGTTTVLVEVQTDIDRIYDGDEYMPGWVARLGINGSELDWFALVNENTLEGKQIELFNTYKMDYVADIMKKKNPADDKMYAAMSAWVVIDPVKPVYATKELGIGDELGGWTIDDIKVTTDPAKADIVSKITAPITVLDTEIMEAGLDSVDSNLILIGGPVVNSVTAALADKLGVPSDYDGWKSEYGTGADSGVIKYVAECGAIGGHGVVLVAGTDREGTKAAAEALMEFIAGLH